MATKMAKAIPSLILDSIIENLTSAAMQKLWQVWGTDVEKELQNLMSTLSAMQAVLEDAEERQFHSKAVKDWLQKLKHIAYYADDLVDEIVTEARQSESAAGSKKRKQRAWDWFTSFLSSSKRGMASRIREINVRLDQIAEERRDLHLETRFGSKQLEITRGKSRRLSSSVRDESSQFLGREDDMQKIVNFLLSDDSSKRNFSIIAIVGMGGVGKTTLAGVVYNDKRITENFKITAWACVSEHFDVERLTKEIITSTGESTRDLSGIDSLQCCLRDKLNGKKFLLVLDDVWSENGSDWELLQAPFSVGAKGSKIIVTARSRAVSNAMQGARTYHLKCLSKQDCWSLFVNQAFYDENADAYPDLIKLGKEVVNKCGGLPLAAKALGGVLSSQREVREWENILKSPIWSLPGTASNIIPALNLSYQHLPAHLKRCFTFCSVYPKDYEFRKGELVKKWVAHGFVPVEEGKQIEDTGSDYFDDLLQRSFFQLDHYNDGIARTTYKMHDLIHDLAQFISGDECFRMEHGKRHGALEKAQHLLYFGNDSELVNLESFYESKCLRTIILINPSGRVDETLPRNIRGTLLRGIDGKVLQNILERLRFIRVLDLKSCKITELPESIGNLKHLRYLDLSASEIKELPESICSIYNMQTLLLRNCRYLVMLPNEMRKLINLRHLDVAGCGSIVSMPPHIGRLTCLQTLSAFYVGIEKERGITELKDLRTIRGELGIEKLENVAEAEYAREANLKGKPSIEGLRLMWSEDRSNNLQNERLEEKIANGLQPHPNLKRLEFKNYMGTQFPSWMVQMDALKLLSNLWSLKLINCSRCRILPPLGCLPSLSDLTVRNVGQVKRIGREFYGVPAGGFPLLKELSICRMLNLEEWQENQGVCFPSLQKLTIKDCPHLRQMPNFNPLPNITYLNIFRCARLVYLPRLPSLKALHLSRMENLEEWCDVAGEADFPHLQELSIEQCRKMRRWPNILPVLTRLTVSDCQGLNELPSSVSISTLSLGGVVSERLWNSVRCFTSLSSLSIHHIPSLTTMALGMLQALTQLKDLTILGCEELVTLEDEFLPLNLTFLWLSHCPSLKSLPSALHSLTSFRSLLVQKCPSITSLPEQGLPSSLERLSIWECPALEARCRSDVGEDWPKILHISHMHIR